jgi:hypothetical protein
VSIIERVKHTVEAKKESYEASAAMIGCILVAVCFLLVGGTIWLSDLIGAVWSCFSFGGAFLVLAVCCWLFGRAKSKAGDRELEAAKQTVSNTVRTASNAVDSFTSNTKKSLGSVEAILAGGLLLLMLYLGTRAPGSKDLRGFRGL